MAEPGRSDFVASVASDLPSSDDKLGFKPLVHALYVLLNDDRTIPPPLEPLVPALAETALFWSAGQRSVAVVHDEQSALTRHRVARLRTYLADAVFPAPPPLLTLTQVDSKADPRVQVADLLAGIARHLTTRPATPQLAELLAPYLNGQPTGWRV